MRPAALSLLPAVLLSAALPARADTITYTSASRTVGAQSTAGFPTATPISNSTTLTGPWTQDVFVFNPSEDGPASSPNSTALAGGGGYAHQTSNLGPESIAGSLQGKAWDGRSGYSGSASSQLHANFTLAAPAQCVISGNWSCDPSFYAQPTVAFTLIGPSGTLYGAGFVGSTTGFSGPIAFSATLPAGSYSSHAGAQESFYSLQCICGSADSHLDFTASITTTGVCCRGATCNSALAAAACTPPTPRAGASFAPGAACNAPGNRASPCCEADYNKIDGVTVQDLFDFLGDWFSASPFAVVGGNGSGPAPTIQSIFDFLGAWFAAGCP